MTPSQIQARKRQTRKNVGPVKLYYHKTDGGAEYLTDTFVRCADGSKEGSLSNVRYVVRIDGNIRKDAELTIVDF